MNITQRLLTGCLVLIISISFTWLFWWPLWTGGGLIGGDIYPYYFPQKAFLSDSLKAGIIPLWNPLVGFGYPTLGESQTGVLYPPNLILYSQLSLNSAYNASQLLHYVIAFVAMWAFARRLKLSVVAALFVATVFVYGWFPARICLEWAIIGGAWFAAILWAATVSLQTSKNWSLVCMALFLSMDLLAGHYHFAFITLIVLVCLPFLINEESGNSFRIPVLQLAILLLMVGTGFLVAAVQLLPSWELKSLSQRQEVSEVFTPTYGHLPPAAISQLWQPWSWYAGETPADRYLEQSKWLSVPNSTNQVEAFVYCGLLTLSLVLIGCCLPRVREHSPLVGYWRWFALALFGLLMATGWPTHFLSWMPGLGFFRGPGRYSIITVLAFAMLSGSVFDGLSKQFQLRQQTVWLIGSACIALLVGDLWSVSRQYKFGAEPYIGRQVFYATLVDHPPITFREQSQLKQFFATQSDQTRLYAPGQNIPTLLGVSSLPVYLGIGPEIYETDQVRVDFTERNESKIKESISRLRNFGVTHLLLEQQIPPEIWEVRELGPQFDELLNRAFGRSEPFYLYEVNNSLGRVSVSSDSAANNVNVEVDSSPNSVLLHVSADAPFHTGSVTLRDLDYPGWKPLTEPADPPEGFRDELFRHGSWTVKQPENDFEFRWVYQPLSVQIGAILSLVGFLAVIAIPVLVSRMMK